MKHQICIAIMNNCLSCGKLNPSKYHKFCSCSCSNSFNKKGRTRTIRKNCKNCGKLMQKSSTIFCNRSCSAAYNTRGRKHSSKTKKKISLTLEIKHSDREFKNNFLKQHPKTGRLNKKNSTKCVNCGVEFTSISKRRTCSGDCLSEHLSRNRTNNPKNCRGKAGHYREIYCQSTWELAFVIWAKDHNKNITRSTKQILYCFAGRKHRYNPDFEISGQIFEIKGWLDEMSQQKAIAAKEQGIEITIIDRQLIKKYIRYVNSAHTCNIEKDYSRFYSG